MRKLFKVPDAKFYMVSRAFESINKFKTDKEKIYGYSQILPKTNGLIKIAISRLDGVEVTKKKRKLETDTFKLVSKIHSESLKNKDILVSDENVLILLDEFSELYNQYKNMLEG